MTDAQLKKEILATCSHVVDTLMAKRQDYGIKNIGMTGRPGLAVRLLDKAARLVTLSGGKTPRVAESLADTYQDIIGYALIGLHGEHWDLEAL